MTPQLSITLLQRLRAELSCFFAQKRGSRAEERSLRALAELGEDELSSLSETGQRIRRQFLRRSRR
jgi:hypothetical protein